MFPCAKHRHNMWAACIKIRPLGYGAGESCQEAWLLIGAAQLEDDFELHPLSRSRQGSPCLIGSLLLADIEVEPSARKHPFKQHS